MYTVCIQIVLGQSELYIQSNFSIAYHLDATKSLPYRETVNTLGFTTKCMEKFDSTFIDFEMYCLDFAHRYVNKH